MTSILSPVICVNVNLNNLTNRTTDKCNNGQFQCNCGRCLKRKAICDGITDCRNAEDEDYSSCGGTKSCADANHEDRKCRCVFYNNENSCSKNSGIPCDSIEDCLPSHDSGKIWLSNEGFPDDECRATCSKFETHNFTCGTNYSQAVGIPPYLFQCIPKGAMTLISKQSFELENGTVIEHTVVIDPLPVYFDGGKNWCNGIVDCNDTSDEKEEKCSDRFYCSTKNGKMVSIPVKVVRNGAIDCDAGEDETLELCNSTRFPCMAQQGHLVSIDIKSVCDFYINCDNGDDEANCSSLNDRFYCEAGQPMFVPIRKVKNGHPDCIDWSDECPTKGSYKTNKVFSSNTELIANLFLRIWIWIMALLALTGNSLVIYFEILFLRKLKCSASLRANHFLVLNLAVADFLMGIYLLSLAIKAAAVSGSYCKIDLIWRSSSTCAALGVISTLSSEASIFVMAFLTGCRLSVCKPHLSHLKPSRRMVRLLVLLAWTIAFVLALLPLTRIPMLINTFTDKAKFTNNPFEQSRGSGFKESKEMLIRLLTYDGKANMDSNEIVNNIKTWNDIVQTGITYSNHPEYFQNVNFFGYYGQSVCIQKFFVTTSNPSWKFSFVVNLINFTSFVFVALSYTAVNFKGKGEKLIRSNNQKNDKNLISMQKKILRLVITDFCCWIPITIMAFVQLGTGALPDEAYAVSAIILLPINSALNPILYSDIFDKCIRKIKRSDKDTITSTSIVVFRISNAAMTSNTYV